MSKKTSALFSESPLKTMAVRGNYEYWLQTLSDLDYSDSEKPFYVVCADRWGCPVFSTEGYLHFCTHQEASDFCYKVVNGELDMYAVAAEADAARKAKEKERAEKKLARVRERANAFMELLRPEGDTKSESAVSNSFLYNLLWEYEKLGQKSKDLVLRNLEKSPAGESCRRVKVELPACHMCEHFFGGASGARKCFLKSEAEGDIVRVAPASLVRDKGCTDFVPRDFRWYGTSYVMRTFCSVFCGTKELGKVLVLECLSEDDADMMSATKREILLAKLFERQLADIGMSDACVSDIELVIHKPE